MRRKSCGTKKCCMRRSRRREEPSTDHAGIHIGRRETSFVDANVDGGATFFLWPCLLECRWLRKLSHCGRVNSLSFDIG